MILPLRYTTILPVPWLNLTLPMVTAMAIVISMVMTMVVTMAMAKAMGVKTMIIPLVVMTMVMTVVMSMMVTMSSVFLYRWDPICVRLCRWFLFALLWALSTLWRNKWDQKQRDFSVKAYL